MDASASTVSAAEFCRLTGVSRERLRNWERRHGYPTPHRDGAGPRRYAPADVARVLTVRRAIEGGAPVAEAIRRALEVRGEGPSDGALAEVVEHAPAAVMVLSGPTPLRVEYLNRAARALSGVPEPGVDPADVADAAPRSSSFRATVEAAFATTAQTLRAERPRWDGSADGTAPVLLVRLPGGDAERPLLAVMDLDPAGEQAANAALVTMSTERDVQEALATRRDALLETCALIAEQLRDLGGVQALVAATDLLVRRLGAVDTALAPHMAGQLVLGRSSRGLLGPEMVTVAAHADLAGVVRSEGVQWLSDATATALGAPDTLHVLAAPAVCAGELLAVLLVVQADRGEIDEDLCRALAIIGSELGFVLLQERLVDESAQLREQVARDRA